MCLPGTTEVYCLPKRYIIYIYYFILNTLIKYLIKNKVSGSYLLIQNPIVNYKNRRKTRPALWQLTPM